MENPEEYKRGQFEESFRNAFEGKEAIPPASVWEKLAWKKSFVGKSKGVNPPPAVWSRIQNELHPTPVRVPFYKSAYTKMAAAAAVLLLIVVFGLNNAEFNPFLEELSENYDNQIVEENQAQLNEESTSSSEGLNKREDVNSQVQTQSITPTTEANPNQPSLNNAESNLASISNSEEYNGLTLKSIDESAVYAINEKVEQLIELLNVNSIDSEIASNTNLQLLNQNIGFESFTKLIEPVRDNSLAIPLKTAAEITTLKIPDVAPSYLRNPNKGFFTQLSFNTGSFDPNFTMQEGDIINAYALTVNSRESVAVPAQMGVNQTPESSMQIGIGLGYKVGKNLMIESGLQYANHSTTSISNVISSPQHFTWGKPVTVAVTNEERLRPQLEFEITDAYQVRNSFQFVSVPLNIGFIIPMKHTEVLLKTGATANVFTGGEITDPNGRLLTEVFKPGVASPYTTLFVQGMVATEVAYKLSPTYSLGVQAGYFFAVSDLAKSNVLFSSQPNQYNLGFVMRYNLPRF